MGAGPRDRLSGASLKPVGAAAVKSRGGERRIKSSDQTEQVSVRKTNESEPFEDASLRIPMPSKPGPSCLVILDKSARCLMTGRTPTGEEGRDRLSRGTAGTSLLMPREKRKRRAQP